jgi:hypothetical protein
MPHHERLLLVCAQCWRAAYPGQAVPVMTVINCVDCFVCEAARGVIWVRANICWRTHEPAKL